MENCWKGQMGAIGCQGNVPLLLLYAFKSITRQTVKKWLHPLWWGFTFLAGFTMNSVSIYLLLLPTSRPVTNSGRIFYTPVSHNFCKLQRVHWWFTLLLLIVIRSMFLHSDLKDFSFMSCRTPVKECGAMNKHLWYVAVRRRGHIWSLDLMLLARADC